MVSIRLFILVFVINIFNDILSIYEASSMKNGALVYENINFLFDKYFCVQISVISYTVYISLLGIIILSVINSVNEDNQKHGIFYITRLGRKNYAAGKITAVALFVFIMCFIAVFQSFAAHRLAGIEISCKQYLNVLAAFYLTALLGSVLGLFSYFFIKQAQIAFLISMIELTAFSVYLSTTKSTVPTADNIPIIFVFQVIPSLVFMILFYLLTFRNDFITTKIKE